MPTSAPVPLAHRPWVCRGSYYQRAWQAVVTHAQGLQHIVQPNTFAMQLPHGQAYARDEAALAAFEAVSPAWGRCPALSCVGPWA